jgi:hypothetical protein
MMFQNSISHFSGVLLGHRGNTGRKLLDQEANDLALKGLARCCGYIYAVSS